MSEDTGRLETLRAYISEQGLKNSKQREIVAEAFLNLETICGSRSFFPSLGNRPKNLASDRLSNDEIACRLWSSRSPTFQ